MVGSKRLCGGPNAENPDHLPIIVVHNPVSIERNLADFGTTNFLDD
jgi:hypothetical protein